MKLFVTGINSFIGSRLADLARQNGHDVFGADVTPSTNSQFYQIDIRDPKLAAIIPDQTDAIIHLAAISRDPDCRANPKESFDINIQGTLNLIDATRAKSVAQFIFASSEWVYGSVSNEKKQLEDDAIDITKLDSEYALSKIVGEQVLRLAFNQGFCPVTILRFGIVYGPRPANWSAVEALLNTVRQDDDVEVGSKNTARRFIHVDDVCRGILSVLGRTGLETFNLSGDDLISLEDIVQASTEVTKQNPALREKSPANVSIRNPDNTKIKAATDWRPSVDLKQGLESVLSGLKNADNL
jgi:nucleoside-diphosphate-sugar epimerase